MAVCMFRGLELALAVSSRVEHAFFMGLNGLKERLRANVSCHGEKKSHSVAQTPNIMTLVRLCCEKKAEFSMLPFYDCQMTWTKPFVMLDFRVQPSSQTQFRATTTHIGVGSCVCVAWFLLLYSRL